MRVMTVIPLCLLVAGIGLVAASVAVGETEVSLVVIFPVLSGSSPYFLLGVALIVASVFAGFIAMWSGTRTIPASHMPGQGDDTQTGEPSGGREYGGVVLIGPIPIAFGSNPRIAYAMLGVGVAVAIILVGLVLIALL